MKQVEVQIMGQSYLLASPDGGEQELLDAATRVDQAMCQIRDSGKIKARDRIAVLAALNLAFDPNSPLAPTDPSPNDPRLDQLIQRIDQALGTDGQLL